MKQFLGSLAALALLSAPAIAADLPIRAAPMPAYLPAFGWSGFYVGVNAGYHWGRDRADTAANPVGWTAAGAAAINGATPGLVNPSGFIGGGQIGYNVQTGTWVWGIELDAAWVNGSESRRVTNFAVINNTD